MRKLNVIVIILSLTFAISCEKERSELNKETNMSKKEIKPPIAERIPKEMEIHGDVRVDDYYWLNERENPKVIDYLNAENAYYNSMTAHTKKFQEDLFEEMKMSLFMHPSAPLLKFAKALIDGVTVNAAEALGVNAGEIKEGKNADMIVLDLDKEPSEELAVHLLLHRYNVSKVYVNGKLEKENNEPG